MNKKKVKPGSVLIFLFCCVVAFTMIVPFAWMVSASFKLKDIGERIGTETLQLYIQDVSASVVRPVKELKGFLRVTLAPGEKREISFEIKESMLRFLRADGTVGSEPGKFRVWIAKDSTRDSLPVICSAKNFLRFSISAMLSGGGECDIVELYWCQRKGEKSSNSPRHQNMLLSIAQ